MNIKELKNLAARSRISLRGCLEKEDIVMAIHKHAFQNPSQPMDPKKRESKEKEVESTHTDISPTIIQRDIFLAKASATKEFAAQMERNRREQESCIPQVL